MTARNSARILVADHRVGARESLVHLLAERWHVDVVDDATEALATARSAPFDLVVARATMPEVGNFLSVLRRGYHVPVILVSSAASADPVEGDDTLIEPLTPDVVVARIDAWLRIGSKRREIAVQDADIATWRALAARMEAGGRLDGLLEAANEASITITGAAGGLVHLYGPEDDMMRLAAARGLPPSFDEPFDSGPHEASVLGEAHRRMARVVVDDVESSPVFIDAASHELLTRAGIAAMQTSPIISRDGKLLGLMSTFWPTPQPPRVWPVLDLVVREVSDLLVHRRREEALRTAKFAAESAIEAKDRFIEAVAHELRNPLAPILTTVEVLRMRNGGNLTPELQIIDRQARHLVALVDDIVDVARIVGGKVELHRRRLWVDDLVTRAVELTRPLMSQRQHQVRVRVSTRAAVHGDEAKLVQAISSLLTNAAKHSEPGRHIDVEARREGPQVVIVVADDGPGLDRRWLQAIFEPFARVRPGDRTRSGFGLGLTLVKSIVRLHGGTVEADSPGLGHGSVFTIRLSIDDDQLDTTPRVYPRSGLVIHRVLVVDDSPDSLLMICEVLRHAGHTVSGTRDAATASLAMRAFHPDVVLVDVTPGDDMAALAARFRPEPGARPVRLVGMGDARRVPVEGAFSAWLSRPVDANALLAALDSQA